MADGNVIVKNASYTYLRSIIGMVLSLLGSRWVLSGLGASDFGIYAVVGAVLIFVVFLNGVLSGGVSRFYSYSMGKDEEEVNAWFNVAMSIHLVFAVLLTVAGYFMGHYAFDTYLNIPEGRQDAAKMVFYISLIGAFFSMVSVPYIAMYTARQLISSLALWGLFQSILVFFVALAISLVKGDRLLFYAISMTSISVLILLLQIRQAAANFPTCRIDFSKWWDRSRVRELFAFSSWSLFGSLGVMLRNQGAAILLNVNFGTVMNSAFGVANQLAGQTDQLSNAMLGAISPEITASEGRGDRERMITLSFAASKLSAIFVMLFSIPLIVEADQVLMLWLKNPPPMAAEFCQIILAAFILDRMSSGHIVALNAKGKVAAYQFTVGMLMLLTLLIAWILIRFTGWPESVSIAFLITTVLCVSGRVYWGRVLLGMSVLRWCTAVLLPCLSASAVGILLGYLVKGVVPPGFVGILLASGVSVSGMSLLLWAVFLSEEEKSWMRMIWNKISARVRPRSAA